MTHPTRTPESVRVAAAALGARATGWWPSPFGLSSAERHVASLDTRTSVFVKGATDPDTARWLRTEHRALSALGGRFAPRVITWIDDPDRPVLVTEDLSDAYWPAATGTTLWRVGDIHPVLATLDGLRDLEAPSTLSAVEWPRPAWANLIESQALSKAGLCSAPWLDGNGGAIVDAHDRTLLLPSLRLEGGPPPATILSGPVELIARLTGSTVRRAVSPRPMPDWLRDVLRRLVLVDLEWLAEILNLDRLDR